MFETMLIYLGFGLIAGFLAGLLGIGGGIVLVPISVYTLTMLGVADAETVQHLALGTSFSVIVFTSISSCLSHNRKGAVLWNVVLRFSPGIVIGVALGGLLSSHLKSSTLQLFFVIFLVYASIQMILDIKPKATRQLPGPIGLATSGGTIGFIASLVGIAGGTITIPFLGWCNVPMHKAVGTSAAVGWPIAVMGAIMMAITGWGNPELPAYTLGYIYLPAVLGMSITSVCGAPLGAMLSHKLPVKVLKRVFAILLIAMALQMGYALFI